MDIAGFCKNKSMHSLLRLRLDTDTASHMPYSVGQSRTLMFKDGEIDFTS